LETTPAYIEIDEVIKCFLDRHEETPIYVFSVAHFKAQSLRAMVLYLASVLLQFFSCFGGTVASAATVVGDKWCTRQ